jgi:hypothetical protein
VKNDLVNMYEDHEKRMGVRLGLSQYIRTLNKGLRVINSKIENNDVVPD